MQVTLPEHDLIPVPDGVFCFDIETYFDKNFNIKKMPMAKYIDSDMSTLLTVAGVARAVDTSDMSVSAEPKGFLWDCTRSDSATYLTDKSMQRCGVDMSLRAKPTVWLIGHNLPFDAGKMRYHQYFPHWNIFYVDTLLMAQYLWHEKGCSGPSHGLGLDALGATLFGVGKMEDFELKPGMCAQGMVHDTEDRAYLKQLAAYNILDTKITWKLFCYLIDRIPADHMYTIHWAVKQFVEPTLKLNSQGIIAHQRSSEEARQELIDKVPGATLKILRSRSQCKELFEAHDIEVPNKMSPTTKKPLPQLAKGDPFILKYQHEKSLRGDIIRARLAAQSAIEITRAATMLDAATYSDDYRFHIAPSGTFTHRPAGRSGGGGNPLNLQRTSKLRRAIEAPPGKILLVFDYSKMELMIARWGAVDKPAMHKLSVGEDMYTSFIASVLNIDTAEVTDGQRFVGKTCLAENTPVLTEHRGWVPIQLVNTEDKVWDGVEWVNHDGLLDVGNRHTMEYCGIVGTPDHHVFCADGTICELQEAKRDSKIITSSATAEGYPIRTLRGGGRMGVCQRLLESTVSMHLLRRLRQVGVLREDQPSQRKIDAVQEMHESKTTMVSPVFNKTFLSCTTALRECKRQGVQELWRAWDRVSVRLSSECSVMGYQEIQTGGHVVWRDRSQEQQRPLQQEEYTDSAEGGQYEQPTQYHTVSAWSHCCIVISRTARSALSMARSCIQSHILRSFVFKTRLQNLGRYKGPLPQHVVGQTQRVYDLANAGPRHRFTILGGVNNTGYSVSNSQLSLQYGVGDTTFCGAINASGKYDMDMHEAGKVVKFFRQKEHPRLPEAWQQCGAMLRSSFKDRVAYFKSPEWDLQFPGGPSKGGWRWPGSGRVLRYPELREVKKPNSYTGMETVFNPMHPINPNATRRIYPSAYFQSLCQSCANEVIDHCRMGLARLGMEVVSECYDELTLIIDPVDEQDAIAAVNEVATTCHLDWWGANPPPLKVDIGIGDNYYDAKP